MRKKVLIIIPTVQECIGIVPELKGSVRVGIPMDLKSRKGWDPTVLVTGAGPVFTGIELSKHLATNSYDLAIQLGICGSHTPEIKPPDIAVIENDRFYRFGAEDAADFIDGNELGFYSDQLSGTPGVYNASIKLADLGFLDKISSCRGITVFTATGSDTTAAEIKSTFGEVLESMEGATFYYTCERFNLPAVQVRAVSNMAGKRDRDSWNIKEALTQLEVFLSKLIK